MSISYFLSDTHLVGGGYFPANRCVSNEETTTSDDLHLLVDKSKGTCVNTYIMQHGVGLSLQVSFSFPMSGFEMKFLSVEVVFQGSVNCKSILWTWFVGSNTSMGNLRECYKSMLIQDTISTSCLVTCSCETHCAKMYLKQDVVFFIERQRESLCEVVFRPDSIVPGAKEWELTIHFLNP